MTSAVLLRPGDFEVKRGDLTQQNGSHERMHRTLKAECCEPASTDREAQQRRFGRWQQEFNEQQYLLHGFLLALTFFWLARGLWLTLEGFVSMREAWRWDDFFDFGLQA
jgi:hypothetical protein